MSEEEIKKIEEVAEENSEEKEESELSEEVKEVKQEKKREERAAIAHIFGSSNNTTIHITDMAGNTISRVTGGMVTKQSRLKSTPTIAMFIAKKVIERPKDLGITSLYVRVTGKTETGNIGPGAHAAIKTLGKSGFKILNILDVSRIPRGGPKKKGGKRGRRV
jgi:ribosomal protein S11